MLILSHFIINLIQIKNPAEAGFLSILMES